MNDTPTAAPMREDVHPLVEQVREILDGIDCTQAEDGGWWETSTGEKFGTTKLAEVEAAILTYHAQLSAEDGYATAFYEIATMLGIGAQAESPANVWRDKMRPKLEALAAGEGDGTASVKRDGQFLLDRLVDHEVRMTSEEDAREWHGHVTPAMARFRVSLADIVEVGPVRTSRFDPPGSWESEPRSSADDDGKAGQ